MQDNNAFRIVLADDHSLIRHGMKNLIKKMSGLLVVGDVADGEELLSLLEEKSVDMIILDISMPKLNGIEVTVRVKKQYPWIKILMLTMHDNQQMLYNAVSAGVDGYLLKDDSDDELFSAIRNIRAGKNYISPTVAGDFTDDVLKMYRDGKKSPFMKLSKREKEILQLVIDGYTSKKIAEHLGLSPRTIDHHRANLLKKFNKKSSIDLVNFAVQSGIIVPTSPSII